MIWNKIIGGEQYLNACIPKIDPFSSNSHLNRLEKKKWYQNNQKKKGVKENEIENIKKKERGKASENINSK